MYVEREREREILFQLHLKPVSSNTFAAGNMWQITQSLGFISLECLYIISVIDH
jgi:hypothetical protein